MEEIRLKPTVFPPAVLNAIAPDVSLQRHLSLNLRPSLRGSEEFRVVEFQTGDELSRDSGNAESPLLGSSVVKCGSTSVVCTITGGIVESDENSTGEHTTVYPVVEVVRGKINGPPTDEEMVVGQQIHELVLRSKILPSESLRISVGFKTADGIVFNDGQDPLLEELTSKKKYSFVLYAGIQVFSRSGPVFDICYASVVKALQNVKLPVIYVDENVTDLRVNSKNRTTIIQESHKLLCHAHMTTPLAIHQENLNLSVTFGVVQHEGKNVLLADIEGDAEETCTKSRISVVVDKSGAVKSLTVTNGDAVAQRSDISKAVALAKKRAHHLLD